MASSIFCGFIAQLVGALHWYCEVMGSNPVEALNCSGLQAIIAQTAIHCDDQRQFDFCNRSSCI